ncbi:MAG: DUF1499 domain-containing protein [Paracoccaceae bacterium]
MGFILFLSVIAVLFALYVRLAPSSPSRWHVPPRYETDRDTANGAARVIDYTPARFARLDEIARHWPHTRVLAGSVGVGKVTYVTRTTFWGFPDYTTMKVIDGKIVFWARSRFGRKDFGVNRDRLNAWLATLWGEEL